MILDQVLPLISTQDWRPKQLRIDFRTCDERKKQKTRNKTKENSNDDEKLYMW